MDTNQRLFELTGCFLLERRKSTIAAKKNTAINASPSIVFTVAAPSMTTPMITRVSRRLAGFGVLDSDDVDLSRLSLRKRSTGRQTANTITHSLDTSVHSRFISRVPIGKQPPPQLRDCST